MGGDFVLDSARKELMLLTQIGVLKDRIEKKRSKCSRLNRVDSRTSALIVSAFHRPPR